MVERIRAEICARSRSVLEKKLSTYVHIYIYAQTVYIVSSLCIYTAVLTFTTLHTAYTQCAYIYTL